MFYLTDADDADQAFKPPQPVLDQVANLPIHDCTFDTVIVRLGHAENEFRAKLTPTLFAASNDKDKAVRDVARTSPHHVSPLP